MREAPFSVSTVAGIFDQIADTFDVARRIALVQEGEDARFIQTIVGGGFGFADVDPVGGQTLEPELAVERVQLGSPLIIVIGLALPFARPAVLKAFIEVIHEAFTVRAKIRATNAQHHADELEAKLRAEQTDQQLAKLAASDLRGRGIPTSVELWVGEGEPPLELAPAPTAGPEG